MWRILIPLALLTGIILLFFVLTGPAHAQEAYKGCIVFEDDSFVCGTLLPIEDGADSYSAIDNYLPRIVGCIPDGLCDTADSTSPMVEVVYYPGS